MSKRLVLLKTWVGQKSERPFLEGPTTTKKCTSDGPSRCRDDDNVDLYTRVKRSFKNRKQSQSFTGNTSRYLHLTCPVGDGSGSV